MNKRGGDFDYESNGGKRARGPAAKCELRIMVPSKMAGSLIGKGGANIQKLRSDYGCSVRLPDCPGPERLLNISAEEWEPTFTCLGAAIPFMYDCPSGEDDGGEREIRLLIHQSVVGGIIGKSGTKVKEIRDNSGTQVKVFSTCCPQSTDRVVQINGTCDKILVALKEILDVVDNSDVKGPDQPYDPHNFDAFFASEYGGYGGGSDGGGGRRGGSGSGGAGREGFSSSSRSGSSRGGGMRAGASGGYGGMSVYGGLDDVYGGPAAFGGGGAQIRAGGRGSFGMASRGGGLPRSGYGGGGFGEDEWGSGGFVGGGRGGYGADGHSLAFSEAAGGGGGGMESTQVTIPNELAGAIIGPGGQRIRKIRNDSHANITIGESDPNSKERIITITGDPKAIQTAQYLLQQSVRDHSSGAFSGF